jgi:hypothetical protein
MAEASSGHGVRGNFETLFVGTQKLRGSNEVHPDPKPYNLKP